MASTDPSLTDETYEGQRNSVGNRSSIKQCRRRGPHLQLSATPSRTPSCRFPDKARHEAKDRETLWEQVGNRSSRSRSRRRGRRLQHLSEPPAAAHGPTRTSSMDSDTVPGTGFRGGNVNIHRSRVAIVSMATEIFDSIKLNK